MLINKAACDYLRLATFDEHWYEPLHRAVTASCVSERAEESDWIQYSGLRGPDWFIGQGRAKDRWHAVAHVSGERSNVLLQYEFGEEVYATRIDLQFTMYAPENYDALKFQRMLGEETWPGRKRTTMLYHSESGDTVYIGSRDSDRYIRIYEKWTEKGQKCLRFEVEYKRSRARQVYTYVTEREPESAMAFMLMIELDGLPQVGAVNFLKVALFISSIRPKSHR